MPTSPTNVRSRSRSPSSVALGQLPVGQGQHAQAARRPAPRFPSRKRWRSSGVRGETPPAVTWCLLAARTAAGRPSRRPRPPRPACRCTVTIRCLPLSNGTSSTARVIASSAGVLEARLLRRDDQGGLGRDRRARSRGRRPARSSRRCTARRCAGPARGARAPGRIDRAAIDEELSGGRVAAAGHVDAAAVDEEGADGHLVPGERPRLVGADHGGGAERLDRGQPADDALPCAPCAASRGPASWWPRRAAPRGRRRWPGRCRPRACAGTPLPRSQPAATMIAQSTSTMPTEPAAELGQLPLERASRGRRPPRSACRSGPSPCAGPSP